MLKLFRMDLYRMVRMKSFYIILAILVALNIVTFLLDVPSNPETETAETAETELTSDNGFSDFIEGFEDAATEESDSNAVVGLSIILSADAQGRYHLEECLQGIFKGMLVAVFIVIFTVIFTTADFNNGYIKNYGGQLDRRYKIVLAKAMSIAVYTAAAFVMNIASFILGAYIAGKSVTVDHYSDLFLLIGVQYALHLAFALFIMALCFIIRNNLIMMILANLICFHVFSALYVVLEKALEKLGCGKIELLKFSPSGRIMLYDYAAGKNGSALLVGGVFIAVSLLASGWYISKKDLA